MRFIVSLSRFKRYTTLTEYIPFGYGVAYWDYYCMQGVAYPIPINLIVRFFRYLRHQAIIHRPTELDRLLYAAFEQGMAFRQPFQPDKDTLIEQSVKEIKDKWLQKRNPK